MFFFSMPLLAVELGRESCCRAENEEQRNHQAVSPIALKRESGVADTGCFVLEEVEHLW